MENIIEALKRQDNFMHLNKVSIEQIDQAEAELNVVFADDYKQYLREYGVATYSGHELTGICSSERLNVCTVTKRARMNQGESLAGLYVIEETNIDDIMIWQASNGIVYETSGKSMPKQIAVSLIEYVVKF